VFSFGEERGTRFLIDDGGAFVQDVNYQPFGKPASTGTMAQPGSALYSNEQWNYGDYLAAFGISKLGARLYDPAIGRFLSRDPLLIPRTAATTNPYAFAANDPVNHSDPTGLLLRPDELPGGKEGGGGGGQSIDWTFVDAEINLLIVLSGGDLIGTDPTIPWLIEIPNIGSSGSGSSSQSPQAAVAAGGLVLTLPKPIPFIGVGAAVGALLAAEGGVLLLGAVPGVGLLILGLVVPAPPGYVPLRCGDYNDHCWKDYMRRVKAENDRQTEILNELEEAAERDKLAKQGKAEADGMTGYPDGMPPDRPGGPKPSKSGPDAPKLISNPKHHPGSESPEPANVRELFERSIVDGKGVRWAKDADGTIHRFAKPSNGETHWNGSTAGPNPIQEQNIPKPIKKALGSI
jgi:RHS repeat-associated protein